MRKKIVIDLSSLFESCTEHTARRKEGKTIREYAIEKYPELAILFKEDSRVAFPSDITNAICAVMQDRFVAKDICDTFEEVTFTFKDFEDKHTQTYSFQLDEEPDFLSEEESRVTDYGDVQVEEIKINWDNYDMLDCPRPATPARSDSTNTPKEPKVNRIIFHYLLKEPTGAYKGKYTRLDLQKHQMVYLEDQEYTARNTYGLKFDMDGEFYFSGDVTITASNPLSNRIGQDVVTIKGNPNHKSVLHLKNKGSVQPCIGSLTHDDMSYGRWSPSGTQLKEIHIIDCDVICESAVPGFTLGSYGVSPDVVPKIVLENATLECPEMHGTRVIKHLAEAPNGSTKISELMSYAILEEGASKDSLLDEEQIEYINKIVAIQPELKGKFDYQISAKKLKRILNLLEMKADIDITPILELPQAKDFIIEAIAVLGLSSDIYSSTEFIFENDKLKALSEKYDVPMESGELTTTWFNRFLDKLYPNGILDCKTEFDFEFIYDAIPAYYFDFSSKTHRECAEEALFAMSEDLHPERVFKTESSQGYVEDYVNKMKELERNDDVKGSELASKINLF